MIKPGVIRSLLRVRLLRVRLLGLLLIIQLLLQQMLLLLHLLLMWMLMGYVSRGLCALEGRGRGMDLGIPRLRCRRRGAPCIRRWMRVRMGILRKVLRGRMERRGRELRHANGWTGLLLLHGPRRIVAEGRL